MNRFRFRVIIGLASVALLALIAVQLYWVQQTYQLRQETLTNKAVECLALVGNKIEKRATCIPAFSKTYLRPGEQLFLIKSSQSGPGDTLGQYSIFAGELDSQIYDFSRFGFSYPALAEISVDYKLQLKDTILGENGYDNVQSFDNVTLQNYRQIVEDDREIMEVLPAKYMDSLIRSTFKAVNIEEPFIYGVKKSGAKAYSHVSKPGSEPVLNGSSIQATILRGRYFRNPHEIVVYFPGYNQILMKSMWVILITSAIIILCLLFAFWYFTRTIHRQSEISQMKSDFINNMTHEFNTPLATISLAGQSLNDPRTSKDPESLSRLSRVISYESQRLFQHIDRILQMGAAENGRMGLALTSVDIHECLRHLRDRFSEKMPDASIELDLFADNQYIQADKVHINNILYNLVDNAIKYSRDEIRIQISTEDGNKGDVIIRIRDFGIGISKDDHSRIFEKFTRLHTGDVHDVKGFGLGLYYIRKAVKAHQGSIVVQSVAGAGSCFVIALPVIQFQDYEQDIAG